MYLTSMQQQSKQHSCNKRDIMNYDDKIQHLDCLHSQNAPQWTFVEQEDFSEYERASRADKDIYGRDDEEIGEGHGPETQISDNNLAMNN